MNINEIIRRLRIITTTTVEGVPESTAAFNKLKQVQDQVGQSAAAMATVMDTSARKQISMADAVERMERRYNSVYRAQQDFDTAQRRLNMAVEQNPALQERANSVMAMAYQRYQDVASAADRAATAQKKSAQDIVSRRTITPDRGEDIVAVGRRLDELRAKYVPLVNVQNAYLERLKELRSAEGRAALSPRELTAEIQRTKDAFAQQVVNMNTARASTDKYAGATGLARHELINMSRQIQDVGVTLAAGQSPMTILVQQGTQIADIFASSQGTVKGFFGQVLAGVGRVITPLVGVSAGLVGIGTAGLFAMSSFAEGQREVERSLVGIGRASGATRTDINKIANESASAFGLSVSEAREFASALAVTGRVGVEQIGEVVGLGKQVAQVYGIDAAEAAKMLGAAYADPARGAEELNKRLGTFDAATLRNIQSLVAQNRIMEAQQLITQGIRSGVEGINAAISTSTNFWTAMGNTISNVWGKFGEGMSRITGIGMNLGLDEKTKEAEERVSSLQRRFNEMSPRVQSGSAGNRIFNQLKAETEELVRLQGEWERYGLTVEKARGRIASAPERAMVMQALPHVGQLEVAEDRAKGLAGLMERINITGGEASPILQQMGQSLQTVFLAARATAEAVNGIKDNAAQTERLMNVNANLRQQYGGMSVEIARQAEGLRDQLSVAQAVTGVDRMRAEAQATYNSLRRDGRTHEEASLIASRQHSVALAQVNTNARSQLAALQDHLSIAMETTDAGRAAAQAQATYNQLIREGVSARMASEIAATQEAIALEQIEQQQEKVNKSIQEQARSLEQQVELIQARRNGTEASVTASQAFENAMRAGASETDAAALRSATMALEIEKAAGAAGRFAGNIEKAVSAASSFKVETFFPERAASKSSGSGGQTFTLQHAGDAPRADWIETDAINRYGRGGYDLKTPNQWRQQSSGVLYGQGDAAANQQGLETIVNGILSAGGSLQQAINQIKAVETYDGKYRMPNTMIGDIGVRESVLGDLYDRLSNEQGTSADQQAYITAEIDRLRAEPRTLGRDDVIKQLTDKLEQLKKATDANTAATIGLSDLYSAGHSGKIGFYQEGERNKLFDPSRPMVLPPSMMTNSIVLPPGTGQTPNMDTSGTGFTMPDGRRINFLTAANGLEGMVGGTGGTDSKLMQARVTPGEFVSIKTPAQQQDQGKVVQQTVIQNFNFDVKGDAGLGDRRTRRQIFEGFGNAAASSRTVN